MKQESISGKIEMLRIHDLNQAAPVPVDAVNTESVVQLNSTPQSFGYKLHNEDGLLNARLGMLSLLTDAFIHKVEINVGYEIEDGQKHGFLKSVEIRRY